MPNVFIMFEMTGILCFYRKTKIIRSRKETLFKELLKDCHYIALSVLHSQQSIIYFLCRYKHLDSFVLVLFKKSYLQVSAAREFKSILGLIVLFTVCSQEKTIS